MRCREMLSFLREPLLKTCVLDIIFVETKLSILTVTQISEYLKHWRLRWRETLDVYIYHLNDPLNSTSLDCFSFHLIFESLMKP